jgi:hypothetical protein
MGEKGGRRVRCWRTEELGRQPVLQALGIVHEGTLSHASDN